jgi:hypothetical protein
MSYAVQTAPVPEAAPRRPVTVQLAAGLLALMALIGLGYAIATLAVTPGVLDRFRDAAGPGRGSDIDGYVTGVWLLAALGAVLAVIIVALYVVLALGLRRGSRASRTGTWVVCGLGVLFGCGTTATVAIQRAGAPNPASLGAALTDAYPGYWIPLNISLAVAQMVGYLVVALLLAAGTRGFFRRTAPAVPPAGGGAYVTLPTYGSANAYPPQSSAPLASRADAPPASRADAPPASGPGVPPPSGPDDDYWSRPAS